MEIFKDKINLFFGGVVGVLGTFFGQYSIFFLAFLALNVLDYVTGIIKSRSLHITSSSSGAKGIAKKVGYWVMVVIAFLISTICIKIGELVSVDLGFMNVLGYFVLALYIINELRSVIENLTAMDVYIPPLISKVVEMLARILDVAQSTKFNVVDNKEKQEQTDTTEKEDRNN